MAEKECEGCCPYCDSDDITYIEWIDGDQEWESEEYLCEDCQKNFIVITYIEQIREYHITKYEELSLDEKTLFDK